MASQSAFLFKLIVFDLNNAEIARSTRYVVDSGVDCSSFNIRSAFSSGYYNRGNSFTASTIFGPVDYLPVSNLQNGGCDWIAELTVNPDQSLELDGSYSLLATQVLYDYGNS